MIPDSLPTYPQHTGTHPAAPLVAISILNWNGWRDTIGCLESIQRTNYGNYSVIVVDNGSKDDSIQKLRAWMSGAGASGGVFIEGAARNTHLPARAGARLEIPADPSLRHFVLISNDENAGFPGGHNLAIRYALGQNPPPSYVLVLNNDAKLAPDCLAELVHTACQTRAGITGAVIRHPVTGQIESWGRAGSMPLLRQFFEPIIRWPKAQPQVSKDFWPAFWVSGAAMLISRAALECLDTELGRYLDPQLFLYFEELELSSSLRSRGYETAVCPRAHVFHREAGSSGGSYTPVAYYYLNRNRVLLGRRLLPVLLRPPFHLVNMLITSGRIAKMLYCRRFLAARAIALGTVDGYRRRTGKWRRHDCFSSLGSRHR